MTGADLEIIDYTPALRIVNLEQLPRGTGCGWLEVIRSNVSDALIAKQWRRVMPASGIIVTFKRAGRTLVARGSK